MKDILLQTPGSRIGGTWECTADNWMDAVNPATGAVLARIPKGTRETAGRAIAAATAAQPGWEATNPWRRADLCHALADAILAARPRLAQVLTLDQGKPLAQAESELGKAADGFRLAADLCKYMTGETIPTETPGRLVMTLRRPRGVYAVVTPWNFPVNIPVEYLAPAIATGNTVVWVPAPSTALIAVEFMAVLVAAGLPDGVINMVLGDGQEVGDEIVVNPGTQGIGFTGSTVTGHRIATRGAGKPQLLELGGNGPLIVRADADLDAAADAAAAGAFGNAGQICAATGRVLADARIAEALAEKICTRARAQVLGDPMDPATTMGPLNNADVAAKVDAHVQSALAGGARCLIGGKPRPDLGSDFYFEPTVLVDVRPDMDVARQETFGPVVPVLALDGDAELMAVARDTEYGLSMGIFSADIGAAMSMATQLRSGIVNINERNNYWELHLPFGGGSGTKSGIGRIGGRHTLEAMTEIATITMPHPAG